MSNHDLIPMACNRHACTGLDESQHRAERVQLVLGTELRNRNFKRGGQDLDSPERACWPGSDLVGRGFDLVTDSGWLRLSWANDRDGHVRPLPLLSHLRGTLSVGQNPPIVWGNSPHGKGETPDIHVGLGARYYSGTQPSPGWPYESLQGWSHESSQGDRVPIPLRRLHVSVSLCHRWEA